MAIQIDKRFGWLMHDHKDYETDINLLKNIDYVIPIWNSITANTGTVTVPKVGGGSVSPTLYTISPDRFPGLADAIITEINGVPTETPAYTAGGVLITTTLNTSGAYALSGTPASPPVAIIFVITIKAQYLPQVDLTYSWPDDIYSVQSFLSLTDSITKSYTGNAGKVPTVNAGETGLELTTPVIPAPRVLTLTTTTSPFTPDFGSYDDIEFTALDTDLLINNPTGVVANGRNKRIRIYDNGVPRLLTYGGKFKDKCGLLPGTTIAGKCMYLGFIRDTNLDTFDFVSIANEP